MLATVAHAISYPTPCVVVGFPDGTQTAALPFTFATYFRSFRSRYVLLSKSTSGTSSAIHWSSSVSTNIVPYMFPYSTLVIFWFVSPRQVPSKSSSIALGPEREASMSVECFHPPRRENTSGSRCMLLLYVRAPRNSSNCCSHPALHTSL